MDLPGPSPSDDPPGALEALLARGGASEVVSLLSARDRPTLTDEERLYLVEALHLTGNGAAAIEEADRLVAELLSRRSDGGDPDVGDPDVRDPDVGDPDVGDPDVGAHDRERDEDMQALATAARALALIRRGDAASFARARESIDQAARTVGRPLGRVSARLYHADGVLRLAEGDFERARVSLLWALASARRGAGGDGGANVAGEWRAAAILDTLGMFHARCGDAQRATQRFGESLVIKRVCGDVLGQAITHGNLGRLQLAAGDPEAALAEFDADLRLAREAGDAFGEVVARNGRGTSLLAAGRLAEAESELIETRALARERGLDKPEALCAKDLALVAERAGRIDDALALIEESAGAFARQGNPIATGFVRTVHGRILYRANRLTEARAKLTWAVGTLRGAAAPELLADALVRLAEVDAEDDPDGAETALVEAEELARRHYLRDVVRDVRAVREQIATARRAHSRALPEMLTIGADNREYLLIRQLSSGAQGEAWEALDAHSGQLVVIKRMRLPEVDESREMTLQRMHGELEASMRVDHPGVVRVFGFERRGRDFFLSMELLPGPELKARMDAGPVDVETAWRWIADLADALEALRLARIVHRDLKPENIVFGPDDRPVLIDFGIALAHDAPTAEQPEVAGTFGYMAPEQILGQPIDHRADLFAFGVLATELLTGRHFLRLATRGDYGTYFRIMAVASQLREATTGIEWPEHVTERQRDAVLRLLQPKPADRFASAPEFLLAAGVSQ